jgi:anthranilate synthase component 2
MIFVLDNYDSFTWNLVQRLGEIDPALDIRVARNDQTSLDEIERLSPERIIISPGPCTPREAGLSCEVVTAFGPRVPLLGVCLGHQCISDAFGGQVVRADRLMHGKVSLIHHNGEGLFAGLKNPFTATRYHSLVVPADSLSDDFEVTAWTDDADHPREVMGLRHRRHPIHGVQFHPESFLTEEGIGLLKNFLVMPAERVQGSGFRVQTPKPRANPSTADPLKPLNPEP